MAAALIGLLGRVDPWGLPWVDGLGRAAVAATTAWIVLRLLPGAGLPTSARLGRAAMALGAALIPTALDGWIALAVWALVIVVALAVGGPIVRTVAGLVALLAVAAAAAGGVALVQAAGDIEDLEDQLATVENQLFVEPDAVVATLDRADGTIESARSSLDVWWARPARFIPVVSHHFLLGDAVIDSSAAIVEAARPIADTDAGELLTLGRLDLGRIEELSGDVAVVAGAADEGLADLEGLDRRWFLGPARSEVDDALDELRERTTTLDRLARLSHDALPYLGADGPQRWFVLVCTPAEARATCGFPGNWVEIVIDDGAVDLVDSGRINTLERLAVEAGLQLSGPPELVAHYGRFDPVPTLRNITLSPDFPSSAEALATAVEELGRPRPDVIAAVNTDGLEGILRVTGPVDSGPMGVLNPGNVRQRLDLEQYNRFETQQERTDALEEASRAVVEAITVLSDVDARTVRRLSEPIDRGGLLAWVPGDPDNPFVEMGVSGALPDGPVAGITAQNSAANKLDAFRSVAMTLTPSTADTSGCGRVELALGEAPPGSPPYVVENSVGLPAGWTKSWVSIYTPTPVVSATLDGEPVELERRDELGHPVVALFVDTAPNSTSTIEFVLQEGETDPPVTLVQPSVEPYTVTIADTCS